MPHVPALSRNAYNRDSIATATWRTGGWSDAVHYERDRAGARQGLDAGRLRQPRLALSRQLEEHAQTVIETFLVVPLFPFSEGAEPGLALSAKGVRDVLVKPAPRLGCPLNPHRGNVRPASLEETIPSQHAPTCRCKQFRLPRHG